MKLGPRTAAMLRESAALFIRSDKPVEFFTSDGRPEPDPRYAAAVNVHRVAFHAKLTERYGDKSWEV